MHILNFMANFFIITGTISLSVGLIKTDTFEAIALSAVLLPIGIFLKLTHAKSIKEDCNQNNEQLTSK